MMLHKTSKSWINYHPLSSSQQICPEGSWLDSCGMMDVSANILNSSFI